uniref:translation initiation factor n=1 Tax=Alloprevotella sp. TaxID=1872471 RepID=UPI00402988FB
MVYSTNPNFAYTDDETIIQTLPKNQQKLRLSMERAGRGGKTVTLVRGFIGADSDLKNLCKLLKQKCGVGGTTKEGEIIIQGDHRPKLLEILKKEGYTQTK